MSSLPWHITYYYFTLQNGKKSHITIPEGSYEIDDISSYLSEELAKFVDIGYRFH
jgi:hypothetical protein